MTSTATLLPPPEATQPAHVAVRNQPVTLPRVVVAEWIKFRSLRSTISVLAASVAAVLILAMVIAYNTRHLTSNLQPDDHVQSSTMQGYLLAQLLIGALGVLFASGEYSTGMIRSTLAAVPKRLPVLWAKVLVFLAIAAVTMITSCVIAFLGAQALIGHYRTGYSLSDPGVLRVVIGTGVYLTLVGLLGVTLGWIVRSTPGALVSYVGLILVLPLMFTFLGGWGKHVAEYFPSSAGGSFVKTLPEAPSLSPWVGLGVLGIWVVAALGAAAFQLRRLDA